jgi:hypothetical protein
MTTIFLRLMEEQDKSASLRVTAQSIREGRSDPRTFTVQPDHFRKVPGAPFSYWVGSAARDAFERFSSVQNEPERKACFGLSTKDDARFVRLNWECHPNSINSRWFSLVKGGAFSRYYFDPYLTIDWERNGARLKAFAEVRTAEIFGVGSWSRWINNWDTYFRPGVFWSRRSQKGLSFRVLPSGCIYTDKAPVVFSSLDSLLANAALLNSEAFRSLVDFQISFGSFEVGAIQRTPIPTPAPDDKEQLNALAKRAWSLKRIFDTVKETSHAFLLPAALRDRLGDYDPPAIEAELARVQGQIDEIAFNLYGFSDADRVAVTQPLAVEDGDNAQGEAEDEDEATEAPADTQSALLSWAVGVAFGRFDWRLATGERAAPPEPEPFAPLPIKSPGSLPDGFDPFHLHPGLLVDDPGHPHDLAHLVEEVLARVETLAPDDVRRWLQREFFAFHLQRYSKSRRKAPIYWPLTTVSGSYTLWIYYPSLTNQTLYTAINDFVEPKLKRVGDDVSALRNKGAARSRDDERQLEALQAFELELIELRDTLLTLAPTYKPNHDDGVQITAAPLWPLFRHKPWQKLLKENWAKLEKGDYDWAHLAMNYRPNQVREKCKTDKSLAIAHGLEDLYVEPDAKPKKGRGQKNATG